MYIFSSIFLLFLLCEWAEEMNKHKCHLEMKGNHSDGQSVCLRSVSVRLWEWPKASACAWARCEQTNAYSQEVPENHFVWFLWEHCFRVCKHLSFMEYEKLPTWPCAVQRCAVKIPFSRNIERLQLPSVISFTQKHQLKTPFSDGAWAAPTAVVQEWSSAEDTRLKFLKYSDGPNPCERHWKGPDGVNSVKWFHNNQLILQVSVSWVL